MPTTINASNTTGGAVVTGDGSGVLELQSGGVTGITVNGPNVTTAGNVVVGGTLTATGGIPQITTALTSPVSITGNSTAGAEIRLPEDTDNGSNYVAIKAPNSLAANLTFTLPSADGTSGQYLQTNGSGGLSFASVQTDPIGTFRTVTPGTNPGSGYILANGAIVLQSTYPALFAVTGLQSTGASSFQNFALGGTPAPRAAASNRTNLVMVIKSDGSVWTGNRTSGFTEVGAAGLGGEVTSLNHFNGTWVATSATSPFIRFSTNAGVTWSSPTTAPSNAIHRAVYANDRWVALSNNGSSWSATSINTWSTISGIANAYDCAYGNGRWVITRTSSQLYYSSDFSTWTTTTVANLGTTGTGNNIIWTGNLFIAVYSNIFCVSTDGINFGRGSSTGGSVPANSLALMEGGEIYYLVSTTTYGLTTNGVSLSGAQASPAGNQNNYPTYLDGYIYACFSNNEFITAFPMYSYNRSTQFVIPTPPVLNTQFPAATSLTYIKAS